MMLRLWNTILREIENRQKNIAEGLVCDISMFRR